MSSCLSNPIPVYLSFSSCLSNPICVYLSFSSCLFNPICILVCLILFMSIYSFLHVYFYFLFIYSSDEIWKISFLSSLGSVLHQISLQRRVFPVFFSILQDDICSKPDKYLCFQPCLWLTTTTTVGIERPNLLKQFL